MTEHRWSKFWWQDWQRDPALRSCSVAARGLWMDMLAIAFDGAPRGHVTIGGKPATTKQLATIAGISEKNAAALLAELEEAGVFSRTETGGIYNRRMVRDAQVSETGREFVAKRWAKREEPTTPPNRGASTPPCSLEAEAEAEADKMGLRAPRAASPPRAERGSRLSPDWQPSAADVAYAETQGVDWQRAAERFRNYWVAKAGKGGVMLDWAATWRNWVLRDAERVVPANALPLKTSQWTVEQQNDEIRRLVGRAPETLPLMRIAR